MLFLDDLLFFELLDDLDFLSAFLGEPGLTDEVVSNFLAATDISTIFNNNIYALINIRYKPVFFLIITFEASLSFVAFLPVLASNNLCLKNKAKIIRHTQNF